MLTFDLLAAEQRRFLPDAEDLGLDPDMFSALGVTVAQMRGPDGRRLNIEAEAAVQLTCDRTLQPYESRIKGTYELALLTPDQQPEDQEEVDQLVLEPQQTSIDLTAAVRDTLLLAVPVRKVAPEAEDLVIETVFGPVESPESTRWAALKQLQEPITCE